jgi:signal transduction histidine kinase
LSIITTALDSIRDDPRLSKLKGDVARMNRIVNQLLLVARLDAVALDISSVVDLDEIAAGVVAAMAPWAIEQGRSIGFDTAGRPVLVRGNADAIEAALRNLLENAIGYSPRGEEVTVRVDRDGSISVTDRGYGIPAEQRERIFERFWRAKGNAVAGAGLGLAIVQQIMKAHRGIVTVRENASMGTVFRLNFPLS